LNLFVNADFFTFYGSVSDPDSVGPVDHAGRQNDPIKRKKVEKY
jgi:hypothetical protein